MALNLMNKSQTEWLQKGGSPDALAFISSVVTGLHEKAVGEGIVHKELTEEVEVEETAVAEEVVTEETKDAEVDAELETEVQAEETATEEVEEEVVEDVTKNVDFATLLTETIFAAQKQYHADVVAPLVKQLETVNKELASLKKEKSYGNIFASSDLLPPAAIAAKISKEFGVKPKTAKLKGEEAKEEEAVTEHVVTNLSDANLFADY